MIITGGCSSLRTEKGIGYEEHQSQVIQKILHSHPSGGGDCLSLEREGLGVLSQVSFGLFPPLSRCLPHSHRNPPIRTSILIEISIYSSLTHPFSRETIFRPVPFHHSFASIHFPPSFLTFSTLTTFSFPSSKPVLEEVVVVVVM